MKDSARVDSGVIQDNARAVSLGACPHCAASVVWAFSEDGPPERKLLDPASGFSVSVPHGSVVVAASSAGRLSVITPWVYRLHVCDPLAMKNAVGAYTPDVLAHSCPVDSCLASPSELCVSARYDVLPRPHGARVALSTQLPWGDDQPLGPVAED